LGGIALADDPPATPTASSGAATTTQRTDYKEVFLGKLASALGIDQAKLESTLKSAEIATIDQAVTNGDLAQNRATEMKQRVEQNGPGAFGLRGLDGPGRGGVARGEGVRDVVDNSVVEKAVADKLGLTVADLQTQLHSGKTLAALAQEKNVNVQDLYKAAADAAKPQLDQAVTDGKLTQAQADQIYQQILQGQSMFGVGRGGPGGMGGGRGRH
jgi:hypothetical protein